VFKTLSKEKKVQFQRKERVTLEPFDGDHVYVSGVFRTLEVCMLVPTISLRIYFSLLHFYGQTLKMWLKF
jgi:hypothetical protein